MPDRRNLKGGESSAPEIQTNEGRKPVRGDRRRQEQQRAERQKRLAILSWNAGPKRGKTANCVVGSFHMILVQEAETHCHDIVTRAKQQFHIHQGADQVILCNNTFEPESARIQEEILGTSKQDSCGLRYLLAKSRFERWPKQGGSTYTAVSAHLSNTSAKRRDVAKQLMDQLRKSRRGKPRRHNCR